MATPLPTIIKAPLAATTRQRGESRVFNLEDLALRGEEYIARARNEAAKLLVAARSEAAAIRKNAELAGENAAREAARLQMRQEVEKRVKPLFPLIEQVAAELRGARDAWIATWERSLVRLALAMAGKIVRKELSRDPGITRQWVREALELLPSSTRAVVRLHPGDREVLGEYIHALAHTLGRAMDIEIVADEAVASGECVVQSKHGMIDQQLDAQLRRLEEELGD